MKARTVQRTLFFSYFIPILLTVTFLSLIFFIYTSRVLRSEEESNLTDVTDKIISIIDSEISKMNNLSLNITNSAMLKENITEYQNLLDEGLQPESTEVYLVARDIANMLAMISGPIKTVPQINYIDQQGLLIGSGTYNLIHKLPIETAEAMIGIDREYGKRHFSGSIRDPLAEEAFQLYKNQEYISLFRTIFDLQNKKQLGVIEVKQFSETIFYGASKVPKDFLIFSQDNSQIFPPVVEKSATYTQLLKSSPGTGIVSFKNPATGEREIISIGKCREIGWTILNITKERNILKPVYRFLLVIIVSGAIMFIISTTVAGRLSRLITQSLSQLNGWISNLHWDNLSSETPANLEAISQLSEFEEIHQEFWKMNRKLNDSMKLVVKERTLQENARMLALQSQMDPHFMYNMLTTIGIMAEDGESENIVETISHLTSILRYTASRSRLYVPVKEEIAVTKSFLTCMKIRFGNDLDYSIVMNKKAANFMIPKLIILPLVENSMKYATDGKPPWKLKIAAEADDSQWSILVEDSGRGFGKDALENIHNIITCCDEEAENQLNFHFDGLGLPNIYSRLKIYFNDNVDFQIYNSSSGACVRMGGPVGGA